MMEEYTIAYAKVGSECTEDSLITPLSSACTKGELDCNGSRNTCPCEDKKITTGELCLGSIRSNSSDIGWYHWTCTPDRIIRDIKSEYSRPEDMDGYSDLEEEDMERIKRAWKYDHILEIEKPEPYMKQQPRKEEDQVVAESEEMHSNMQDQNDSRQKKQHNHQSSKTVSSVHSTTTSKVFHSLF
ncbi:hypothetical protein BD560DRAFT_159608 [Blakeslea trispora]|nr:hypothetical protein BD560DRAFT_159608 [Blakeslea trispora]